MPLAPQERTGRSRVEAFPATAPATFLRANTGRAGATVYNASDKALFVKLGSGAASDSYTLEMEPNGYYEVPFDYAGEVSGAWEAGATGLALVTELF
jgi:hypothetical protein